MKRFALLAFMPLVLFALEPVNLIKDAGFERESKVWQAYTGSRGSGDSAIANTHDPQKAFQGSYSGSCDTRIYPGNSFTDSALIIQGFCCRKTVSDIDSINLYFSNIPLGETPTLGLVVFIGLFIDSSQTAYRLFGYYLKSPDQNPGSSPPWYFLEKEDFPSDSGWYPLFKHIHGDLAEIGVPEYAKVDSFLVAGWGAYLPPWRGQITFFDAIRLTGYADYDVGVKEILSGDSVWAGVYYKPVARIKSFGRQAADNFDAIAEIRQGETIVWADTIPYTLPADTEDTLEFDSFPIPNALDYTLTVRTEMYAPGALDESDEDDALSKPLYGTAIAELVTHSNAVTLEVNGFGSKGVLRVVYSLPQGQSGTISIYDASGRRLESLKVQGSSEVEFTPLSSGVYFVRLEAGSSAITRKAVIK